jgi:cytochrome b561
MAPDDAGQHYTGTAKLFHWLTVLGVGGLFALGHYMTTLELSPLMLSLYSWHKWIGITVLTITVVRLFWRLGHRPPCLPATMSPVMQLAADAGHWALYGLLLGMPLVGWLFSSASGFPVVLFGVLPLPNLVGTDKALADTLGWLHWVGGWAFAALIIGHAGAAVWHHVRVRDDTLVRMLPGGRTALVVALAIVAGFSASGPAPGKAGPGDVWILDRENSQFTFAAKQLNVPVNGQFKSFTASIIFDPSAPDAASIDLMIDAESIATGNAQADQLLPGPDWFDAAQHPNASFNAKGFKAVGGDSYEIAGDLMIKGHKAPVTVSAVIELKDDPGNAGGLLAVAQGEATVSRTAYKVGLGQWADTNTIADEVVIGFKLTARRPK